jgi:hypothetical protein
MVQLAETELETIGRDVARSIVGVGQVAQVDVVATYDSSDQPAYYFSFLFDQDSDRHQAALLRVRLAQKLRDALIARGDSRYPFVRVLRQQDWGMRAGA